MLNGWIRPKEWMAIWLDVGRSGFETWREARGCLRFLYKYGRRRAVILILKINMALI